MINRRNTENRVNKINEAALRFVYDDSASLSFDELLTNDKSVIIHQRNLHFLATENFKVKKWLSTGLTEGIRYSVDSRYNELRGKMQNSSLYQYFLFLPNFELYARSLLKVKERREDEENYVLSKMKT